MHDLTGTTVGGRYRVEEFLGRGGMASVYKVWDAQRAALLAMKVLHSDLADDAVFLRRFKREGQTLESLQHPHIVRFYGLEESDGLAYILMDFIEGMTLRREISLNKRTIRPARMLQILRPVCSALHYAHQQGLVHCDIKPLNIMIQRSGMVYLTDFGIARVKGTRTEAPSIAGTPAYMAPEQMDGSNPTSLSDQYALGIVLYEMLTGGERPFTGQKARASDTAERILLEKKNLPVPHPAQVNPDADPRIADVALRSLQVEPADRFESMLDFLHGLEQAVHGSGKNYDVQTVMDIPFPSPGLRATAFSPAPAASDAFVDGPTDMRELDLPERDPVEDAQPPNQTPVRTAGARWRPTPIFVGGLVLVLLVILATIPQWSQTPAISPVPSMLPTGTSTIHASALPVLPQEIPPTASATAPQAALSATDPTPQPTVTGGGQNIAFASDRNGTVQIWIMDSAKPGRHYQLTNLPQGACQPAWSPDGKRLAFITPCNGPRVTYPGARMMIIDLESKHVTDLGLRGGAFEPDWSPDGRRIAYTTYNAEKTEIHMVELETGKTAAISTRGTRNSHADWSPDGISIVFSSDDNGIDEIWRVRVDGTSLEVLTNAGLFRGFTRPEWSPDGLWIAASMKELDSPAPVPLLVLLDPDMARGGGEPLLPEPLRIEDASFSPDGQWFTFWYVLEGNNMEIARMSRDGEIFRLTDHKARDFHPTWSPLP